MMPWMRSCVVHTAFMCRPYCTHATRWCYEWYYEVVFRGSVGCCQMAWTGSAAQQSIEPHHCCRRLILLSVMSCHVRYIIIIIIILLDSQLVPSHIHPSVCLSVCLPIHPIIYLSNWLTVCLWFTINPTRQGGKEQNRTGQDRTAEGRAEQSRAGRGVVTISLQYFRGRHSPRLHLQVLYFAR